MRIVYLGSGAFGLPTLKALLDRHDIALVVSQPDRPAGRGRHPTPTPVAAFADVHGMPLLKTEDVNRPECIERIHALKPDAMVVIAFGQKLLPALLAGQFAINLHGSLLPRHRGAAPINWALLSGDRTTGVSVITLAQRMDAGAILATAETAIDPKETAGELHDRLAEMGPAPILKVLDLLDGRGSRAIDGDVQDETLATRAPKLSRADAIIDLTQPAKALRQRIHGLSPWPGVAIELGGIRLRLLRVEETPRTESALPGQVLPDGRLACGAGALRLLEVRPSSGRSMTMDEFLRGHRAVVGMVAELPTERSGERA